mmetsp:Transcript_37567/g.103174  ORF Transcript_37567/g.103174 Transcript_37567/m.103174 type:complete len:239 (+) Transcript_37567:588-1304(+)
MHRCGGASCCHKQWGEAPAPSLRVGVGAQRPEVGDDSGWQHREPERAREMHRCKWRPRDMGRRGLAPVGLRCFAKWPQRQGLRPAFYRDVGSWTGFARRRQQGLMQRPSDSCAYSSAERSGTDSERRPYLCTHKSDGSSSSARAGAGARARKFASARASADPRALGLRVRRRRTWHQQHERSLLQGRRRHVLGARWARSEQRENGTHDDARAIGPNDAAPTNRRRWLSGELSYARPLR